MRLSRETLPADEYQQRLLDKMLDLARVEDETGVQILRRGNQLAIVGEAEAQQQAGDVLKAMYARLEAGRPLEPGFCWCIPGGRCVIMPVSVEP